jgi:membrane AbrB-like protein
MFNLLTLRTLAIALAGVAAFWLAGLPLPFLFGPMAACLLAALAGVRLKDAGRVGVGMRTILGLAVGASITPALLAKAPVMALTLALVPVYVLLIALIGVPYFHRLWGFERKTAYFAAMPGGMQDMVVFGIEAGADARALSLIHATRVLITVVSAPLLLAALFGATFDAPIGAPVAALPPLELVVLAGAALAGWLGGERIGLFGASILGPMIVAAALSLTDILHTRPPAEAIQAAQVFIGMGIGAHFSGVTLRELGRDVAAGAVFALMLAALAAAFMVMASTLGGAPAVEAFLSFAPGGQAEMTVLAIVAGADLGFVVLHHLTRIVLVITGAPIVARLALRRKP